MKKTKSVMARITPEEKHMLEVFRNAPQSLAPHRVLWNLADHFTLAAAALPDHLTVKRDITELAEYLKICYHDQYKTIEK